MLNIQTISDFVRTRIANGEPLQPDEFVAASLAVDDLLTLVAHGIIKAVLDDNGFHGVNTIRVTLWDDEGVNPEYVPDVNLSADEQDRWDQMVENDFPHRTVYMASMDIWQRDKIE